MTRKTHLLFLLLLAIQVKLTAQIHPLITNIDNRERMSLNGNWNIIIDPYENGFYNYRAKERGDGFFLCQEPQTKQDLIEYDFDKSEIMKVPGDWNSQMEKLEFYEGTIWYKKSFSKPVDKSKRYFIYIGAANYHSIVYLNGKKLGEHEGGFTPFNFEVTDIIKSEANNLVLKVDNKRRAEAVPTLNTDWWNYGGITRDVYLVETPQTFAEDYFIQLEKGSLSKVKGWIKLNGKEFNKPVNIQIPELKISYTASGISEVKELEFNLKKLQLWSPENPKLYEVLIIGPQDTIKDYIGFRSIEVKGQDILLNGQPIFLRGICLHEEAPFKWRRANGPADAAVLLNWAKELGCNYVRLAHYPHNEAMTRLADKLGIMVWSEIPVYWTIQYENKQVFENAKSQLTEMITRDRNKASIIIWSMANETPVKDSRNQFIKGLAEHSRTMDPTRLISAALEVHSTEANVLMIDDPLGEYLDVLGCNEYIGWYWGKPEDAATTKWATTYNKPLVFSEFGGDALFNLHGQKDERWTEEYQENIFINQTIMFKNIPFLKGTSPWVLMDFRSPRRQLPGIQDFWNRKGLISDQGQKKKAFYIMKKFYEEQAEKYK